MKTTNNINQSNTSNGNKNERIRRKVEDDNFEIADEFFFSDGEDYNLDMDSSDDDDDDDRINKNSRKR